MLRHDQAVPAELPEGAARWLELTGHVPYWANRRRLERGVAETPRWVLLVMAPGELFDWPIGWTCRTRREMESQPGAWLFCRRRRSP